MSKEDLFECTACGLHYKQQDLADKCRDWCEKYSSCNIEITKESIEAQSSTSVS